MTLDNEKQRTQLLGIIKAITVSGEGIDEIYALKQAIINAEVSE